MRSLKGLTDRELIDRLRSLVKREQSLTIETLPHLAEVDKRELYLAHGYGSLLDYCVSHLGYSESSAGRRVRAARVIGLVPEVYDLLKAGKLTFGGVLLLSGALRPENKTELLARVIDKTHGQIERIVAEYKPPRRIPDQARPTLVMTAAKRVPGEVAKWTPGEAAGESSNAREPKPSAAAPPLGPPKELGHLTRQTDGLNAPPRTALPAVELERMYEIRFARSTIAIPQRKLLESGLTASSRQLTRDGASFSQRGGLSYPGVATARPRDNRINVDYWYNALT